MNEDALKWERKVKQDPIPTIGEMLRLDLLRFVPPAVIWNMYVVTSSGRVICTNGVLSSFSGMNVVPASIYHGIEMSWKVASLRRRLIHCTTPGCPNWTALVQEGQPDEEPVEYLPGDWSYGLHDPDYPYCPTHAQ